MRGLFGLRFLCLLSTFFPFPAFAQVNLGFSTIPECFILSPGPRFPSNPIGEFTMIVRDATGIPVAGAAVLINFTAQGNSLITWCGGQPPSFQGLTQENGSITFEMFGSACISHEDPSTTCAIPVADVLVSGPPGIGGAFTYPMTCVRSPDVVNTEGARATCSGSNTTCMNGKTDVGLSDAVYHTLPIKLGLGQPCSKFVPPYGNAVTLNDAVVLTPYIKLGTNCGC